MNTVEILIYIILAFIVGSLIYGFIADWNVLSTYHAMKDEILGEREQTFDEITTDDLLDELIRFEQQCAMRERERRLTLYLEGEGNYTKEDLFDQIKAISLCNTLSSAEYGCGEGEDINFTAKRLPGVITLRCTNESITIT